MDVLVVGGSGSLGSRLTRQARLAGHRVVATFHASVPADTDVDWRRLDTLLELAAAPHAGVCHVVGADALSRYELGQLIAVRDGLDPAALRRGLRAATSLPGPLEVRLDSTKTQARLTTRLRGAREFLTPNRCGSARD
jgi:dTDP-4-dehydrorhamnose reductase